MRTPVQLILALVLAGALAAVPFAGAEPVAAAQTRVVRLGDVYFAPGAVTVAPGTTVAWHTTGLAPHRIRVDTGPRRFLSPVLPHGAWYKRRLTRPGLYRLSCTLHGRRKMSMRLRVA